MLISWFRFRWFKDAANTVLPKKRIAEWGNFGYEWERESH